MKFGVFHADNAAGREIEEAKSEAQLPTARRQDTSTCYHGNMKTVLLALVTSLLLVTSACSPPVPAPAGTSPGSTGGSNGAGGVWARLAPLPTARGEVAAAELSGQIYVVGGLGPGASANEEYDPAADAWRKRADIPQRVDHPAAVSLEGRLYVIGGFDGAFGPVASVWAYDALADAWVRKADLPTPRGALGAAVVGGRIYAIGGRSAAADVGANEVYDPPTDTWTPRAPLPTPRDHVAVSAIGGKIYVIGGRFGTFARNTGVNEEYDPQRDAWTERASLPTPRSGIASAVVNDRIYVFGGEGSEGTFNQNERYHPATDSWQAMPPMPTARHGLGAATVGNRIFVLAGGTTPGGSQSGLNEAFTVPPVVTSTSAISQTPSAALPSAATPAFSREQAIHKATGSAGHGPVYLRLVEKRIDSASTEFMTLAEMHERFGIERLSSPFGVNPATEVWLVSVKGYFGFEQKGVASKQAAMYMADGWDLAYDASTGENIGTRSLGLGVVVVPPLAPNVGDQIVSAPASKLPIAREDGVWGLVAGWARDVSPVLRPRSLPKGFESVQVLDARLGTFRVEYAGPGKRMILGVGLFNPPMVTPESRGEQRRVTVRGLDTLLKMRSKVQPSESLQLMWQEPGEWTPEIGAPTRDSVFYMISAQGLDPEAVLQVANSLHPM